MPYKRKTNNGLYAPFMTEELKQSWKNRKPEISGHLEKITYLTKSLKSNGIH